MFTYETVTTIPIENVAVRKRLRDGVEFQYLISANKGYVLHDGAYDDYPLDENTGMSSDKLVQGYTGATVTVGANYDFVANPRELYAAPYISVPKDRIFGGGKN